jgi:glycosyltransferase involved in cell wall biosynthesis
MTASVILPTYNERETIVALINEIPSAVADTDVLGVDDDSPEAQAPLNPALPVSA